MEAYFDHEENMANIEKIRKEYMLKARAKAIQDEKDGIDIDEGCSDLVNKASKGVEAIVNKTTKVRQKIVKTYKEVLTKARRLT